MGLGKLLSDAIDRGRSSARSAPTSPDAVERRAAARRPTGTSAARTPSRAEQAEERAGSRSATPVRPRPRPVASRTMSADAAERALSQPRAPEVDADNPATPRAGGSWSAARSTMGSPDAVERRALAAAENDEENEDPPLTEAEQNAATLERYYVVVDDRGGRDHDGTISTEDLEAVATGDYDREQAAEQLEEQGLDDDEVDEALEAIEETAEYYTDDPSRLADMDRDHDDENDTDGRVSREAVYQAVRRSRPQRPSQSNQEIAQNLDESFQVFDDTGGGDGDGNISQDDLEEVARGDYNRDAARAALREQGVSERDIDARLAQLEQTAQQLTDDDSDLFDELDVAADEDRDYDGDIRRGDLDRYILDHRPEPSVPRQEEISDEQVNAAAAAFTRWSDDPEQMARDLENAETVSDLSEAELMAISLMHSEGGEVPPQFNQVLSRTVEQAESLEDLPTGQAFDYLLATATDDATRDRVSQLVSEDLNRRLDGYLNNRRGDTEADLALDRLLADIEDLASARPGLGEVLIAQAEAVVGERAEDFTDVRRADDSWGSRALHTVTGAVNDVAGFIGDRLENVGDLLGDVVSTTTRVLGETANVVVSGLGEVAAAGLDAVGADGLAESTRDRAHAIGDTVSDAADWWAGQQDNFLQGVGQGASGAVTGVVQAVTDPVGTVQGLATIVRNPGLLIDNYRQIMEEEGVAGLLGNVGFDVVSSLAGGSGAAARLTAIGGRLSRFGSAGSITARVAGVAGRGANVAADALRAMPTIRGGGVGNHLDDIGRFAANHFGDRGAAFARALGDFERSGYPNLVNRVADRAPFLRSRSGNRDYAPYPPGGLDNFLEGRGRDVVDPSALDGLSPTEQQAVLRRAGAMEYARELDAADAARANPIGDPTEGIPSVGGFVIEGRERVLSYLLDSLDDPTVRQNLGMHPKATPESVMRNVLEDAGAGGVAFVHLPQGFEIYRTFDRSSLDGAGREQVNNMLNDRLGLQGDDRVDFFQRSGIEGSYVFVGSDRVGQMLNSRDFTNGAALPNPNHADGGFTAELSRDKYGLVSYVRANVITGLQGHGGMRQIQLFGGQGKFDNIVFDDPLAAPLRLPTQVVLGAGPAANRVEQATQEELQLETNRQ